MKNQKNDYFKKSNKKALSFLKSNKKIANGTLQYCDIQNDYQVFTDSYIAFFLKKYFELPKYSESGLNNGYPNILGILPSEKNGELVNNSKEKLEEILLKIKNKMYDNQTEKIKIDFFQSENFKTYFDVKRIKLLVEILGTTDLEIRLYGNLKTALFVDQKTGNKAILCPVRKF